MSFLPGLADIAGSLIGGVLGYAGQSEANSANAEIAQRQMDFQERMSNTAYQRQVADMQASGLNPMLAYSKGGGASSPAGSSYEYRSPAAAAVSAYESASRSSNIQAQTRTETKRPAQVEAQTGQTTAETDVARAKLPQIEADTIRSRADTLLKDAQRNLASASADQARTQINFLENQIREVQARVVNVDAMTEKVRAETANLPFVQRQLIAAAAELQARVPLINAQAATEVDRKNMTFWLAGKAMRETSILDYDIEAIVESGNFRREFGQYDKGLDMLLKVFQILSTVRGGQAPISAGRPAR